jgi:hypothetical protein
MLSIVDSTSICNKYKAQSIFCITEHQHNSIILNHTQSHYTNYLIMPKPQVLFVLTSHNKLGNLDKPTGWYLVSLLLS